LRWFCRSLLIPVLLVLVSMSPSGAQQDAAPQPAQAPWQDVISSQIQAFRDHDAPAAFMYAGAGFHVRFPDAESFFATIIGSGYSPIMESTSHSFGEYRMVGTAGVIQLVRLVGKDQQLYGALYQLTKEQDGWRVQAVQLYGEQGVAI
jgi:hypothetical protein